MGCDWSQRSQPSAPVLVYVGNDYRLAHIAENYEMLRQKGKLKPHEHRLPELFMDLSRNVDNDKHWLSFFARCRALKIGYKIVN